ncbi:MAG: chloride channel protein [Bacteroidia bacterium]|nr:chloride channel protein [Bacteroidia bacterium]
MKLSGILHRLLVWRIKHINTRDFVLILSVFIGIFSGFAAVILKTLIHYIHIFLDNAVESQGLNYLYLAFPIVGILLTVIYTQVFLDGKLGRGVSNILYEISKKASIVRRDKMYSHLISSSLTVGFGGSVGLEAPIVVTGSAIGSNLGNAMHLDAKKRQLLIGCGAAAAISAIFNAPIAGVLFALEILLVNLSVPSFIPLMIASVFGHLVSKLFLGEEILFYFLIKDNFLIGDVPYFIILGIVTGLLGLFFTRIIFSIENRAKSFTQPYMKAIIGGLSLGILIFIFPPLYGEGYYAIKAILSESPSRLLENSLFISFYSNQWMVLLFIVSLVFIKVFATSFTVGAGGNGGIFAPSLFIGALSGFSVARIFNLLKLDINLSESNFTLVGMAGVCAAMLRAPLTAIFLIAEITSGYELFVPIMLVSAIAYITASYFEPHSLYTKRLAIKGELLTQDKDKTVLSNLKIEKMIETDLSLVPIETKLGELTEIVAKSKRNIFPVINENEELLGIILLDDIREIMFKPTMYDKVKVRELMHAPPATILYEDNMDLVMKKFERTEAWNLPVIKDGKYVGFLSKSNIFSRYRRLLIKETQD